MCKTEDYLYHEGAKEVCKFRTGQLVLDAKAKREEKCSLCGSQDFISTQHYLLDCGIINSVNTPSLIRVRQDIEEEFRMDGNKWGTDEVVKEILRRTDKLARDAVFICKRLEEERRKLLKDN